MTQTRLKNIRLVQKHEKPADWEKAVNFIPLQAEIIVYDADSTHKFPRLKIGDGKTPVNELPFYGENGYSWGDFTNNPSIWGDFTNNSSGLNDGAWGSF